MQNLKVGQAVGGWPRLSRHFSSTEDCENDTFRVDRVGGRRVRETRRGFQLCENIPGQGREPHGLGLQKSINSVSAGAHHQLRPQLYCSLTQASGKAHPLGHRTRCLLRQPTAWRAVSTSKERVYLGRGKAHCAAQ